MKSIYENKCRYISLTDDWKYMEEPKSNKWFLDELKEKEISFEDLYQGTWEIEKPDYCENCLNEGKICPYTLYNQIIY